MQAYDNALKYDWPTWFIGILRSFISGGSSAMVAGLTSMGIAPGTFNLNNSVGNTIKLMGIMFMFQGGYRMFEFLQLHGSPDKVVTEEKEVNVQPSGSGVKVASVTKTTTVEGTDPGKQP
jgi:hypothetical protein